MLKALRDKGLLWPAAMTLVGLVVLISLGNWQMRRLAWKQGLIAAIAERTHAEPVPATSLGSSADVEYARAKAKGRLMNEHELHLYAIDERYGPGFNVITPLKLADGSVLLVNRGYVPETLKDPSTRAAGQLDGEVEIVGLVRRPEIAGLFTPANDAAKNIWYWRDLEAMAGAALGSDRPHVLPFYLDAEAEPGPPGGWPKGGTTRLALPNRHLEYALTWYGLAAALTAVFLAYAVPRWRRPAP